MKATLRGVVHHVRPASAIGLDLLPRGVSIEPDLPIGGVRANALRYPSERYYEIIRHGKAERSVQVLVASHERSTFILSRSDRNGRGAVQLKRGPPFVLIITLIALQADNLCDDVLFIPASDDNGRVSLPVIPDSRVGCAVRSIATAP